MTVARVALRDIRGVLRLVAFDAHGDGLPIEENARTWRRNIYPSPNRARKNITRRSRQIADEVRQ